MLTAAILFFVLALIAAALGYGGVAEVAIDIAWILGAVFLVLLIIWAISRASRGASPPV